MRSVQKARWPGNAVSALSGPSSAGTRGRRHRSLLQFLAAQWVKTPLRRLAAPRQSRPDHRILPLLVDSKAIKTPEEGE